MRVHDFRDLTVWQKSVDLAEAVYRLTRQYPRDELFGLTAQLRSAAISVSSNIAEGNGRGSTRDYLRFLRISKGSVNEVRSLLRVSVRLQVASDADVGGIEALLEEISRMLAALTKSLMKRA